MARAAMAPAAMAQGVTGPALRAGMARRAATALGSPTAAVTGGAGTCWPEPRPGVAAVLTVAGLGAVNAFGSTTLTTAQIASNRNRAPVYVVSTLGYQNGEAAGTGMVLTSTGEVLTNNHVIDGATSVKVTDVGNGRTYSAKVVGYDKTRDVAVLQLMERLGAADRQPQLLGRAGRGEGGRAGQRGRQGRHPVRGHRQGDRDRQVHHRFPDQVRGKRGPAPRPDPDQRGHPAGRLRRPAGQHPGRRGRHEHSRFQQHLDHRVRHAVAARRHPGVRHPDQPGDHDRRPDPGG